MQPVNPASPVSPSAPTTSDTPPVPNGKIVIQSRGAKVTSSGLNHQITVFRKALEMFAGLLAQKKVKLVCRGTDCYTDGNTITIPELSILDRKDMTEEEVQRAAEFLEAIRGFVSHEVGHVLYTNFNHRKIRQFAQRSALHKHVWNVVEDLFIEKKMKSLWAGISLDLNNMNEWAARKIVEPNRWASLPPIAKVLLGFSNVCEKGGDRSKSWFYQGLMPAYQQVIDSLMPEIKATLLADSTNDCVEIAESIIEKLKLANQQPPQQQQPPAPMPKPGASEEEDDEEFTESIPVSVPQAAGEGEADPQEAPDEEEGNEEEDAGEGEAGEDEDGFDGDGLDGDEGEGDEGSGDAEGEGDGDDGEEAEEGDATGTGEADDEGEPGGSQEEEGDPAGTGTEPHQQDFLKLEEELAKSADQAKDDLSMSSLISDEAKGELNKLTRFNSPYTIYSTEWDKVGTIDELMPMLAPHYVVDEVKERQLYSSLERKADAHIGVMKRRLQAILTTQSKPKHHRNLEDGDLDFTNLYKFALTGTDEASRVFKRTHHTFSNSEICVALVVNESGSMQETQYITCNIPDPKGTKNYAGQPVMVPSDPECVKRKRCLSHGSVSRIQLAREVALIFGETLGALGVPFRLVGHTAEPTAASAVCGGWGSGGNRSKTPVNPQLVQHFTRQGAVVLAEYKGWEDRWSTVKHKMVRMEPRNNTYDGEVLLRVANDIMQRKEKRKVIFMLDDGIPEPSDTNREAHRKFLKSVVQDVTAAGVEVICFGMATPQVKEYYPKSVVIMDVAETPMIASGQLKKLLFQSMRK